jgi:transposase
MSCKRYPEELKVQAGKQVTDKGHIITDVPQRLGITYANLHDWIKRYSKSGDQRTADTTRSDEIRTLKAELKRVTEERDILKGAAVYIAGESKKSTHL